MGLMGNQVWRKFMLLILCFIFLSTIQPLFGSKVRHYKWEVDYTLWSPDCVERPVITINGQFPGPTIRARLGDTIVVELTNKFGTEGVTIHWHGIRQLGTPSADGTALISQCPINPGETFVYRFKVGKAGTFFYHGHYGMQRTAGLYGSLIVGVAEGEKEPFHYDGELNLLLSDWWHESAHEQEIGLSAKPRRWINEPQSLLINGRGQYNCTLAAGYGNYSSAPQCKFQGKEQCAPQVLRVLPNKTYRIRITSTDALGAFNLAIGNHNLTVVGSDGYSVEPFTVDNIDIQTGETYSVLITTDQNPNDNYWVSVGIMGRPQQTPSALTILNYLPNSASKLPTCAPPPHPVWVDYNMTVQKKFVKKVLALKGTPKPPKKYDHRIVLLSSESLFDGASRWSINNVSLALPATPYLGAIKYGLKHAFDQRQAPENFPQDYDIMKPPTNPNTTLGDAVYWLKLNTTIDVILQNSNDVKVRESSLHSWHLHGHSFWVLGYGEGKFSEEDVKKFNLKNPPLKFTAGLFPFGWTALRFVTDNPGVWIFHCHFEPHLHMGMGVIFAEGVDHLPKMPDDGFACGLTAKLFMRGNHT